MDPRELSRPLHCGTIQQEDHLSPDTEPVGALTLDFPAFRTVRNKYMLFKLPINGILVYSSLHGLRQGSPAPGPPTGSGPWLVRNWATQQDVSGW